MIKFPNRHLTPAQRITIVEHTRTSEEGTKDLRMVHEEGSVWLLSANKDEAIRRWHRQLLTAQIIGPGTRTSGSSVPSAPFLISRTHNRYEHYH
jgi:hypothetical protein